MKLYSIETGNFKIDGGAIFGVVPKVIWEKEYPADDKNHCNLAMRSLLIDTGDHKILIDTGIGEKQHEKFFNHYFLNGDDTLDKSLENIGLTSDDITDVILTHLHFDHCGGSIKKDKETGILYPAFAHAKHWVSRQQWDAAVKPNHREKASFLKENILPIEEFGQLNLIDGDTELFPGIKLRLFNGHTAGQILTFINYNGKTIVHTGDLIPILAHLKLPYLMAFDMRPEETLVEKDHFLKESIENEYIMFFEHDIDVECCTLKNTERGVREDNLFKISDLT